MTNDEMKAGRFLRWHKARVKVAKIQAALRAGYQVNIHTATRVTVYKPGKGFEDMFKANRTGAYVQHGKRWDCIDFCGITISR